MTSRKLLFASDCKDTEITITRPDCRRGIVGPKPYLKSQAHGGAAARRVRNVNCCVMSGGNLNTSVHADVRVRVRPTPPWR
jgi:hypothetical protein